MSSARPSGMGTAFMKILLCLLGDLDRHMILDSSDTVSLEITRYKIKKIVRKY